VLPDAGHIASFGVTDSPERTVHVLSFENKSSRSAIDACASTTTSVEHIRRRFPELPIVLLVDGAQLVAARAIIQSVLARVSNVEVFAHNSCGFDGVHVTRDEERRIFGTTNNDVVAFGRYFVRKAMDSM
jgi:hypothetical protein